MDGISLNMQTPGSAFLVTESPSTIHPRSQEQATKTPSEIESLAAEIRKMNETHNNFRSDSDRKIQELVQRNNVLQQAYTDSLAREKQLTQPQTPSNDVDNLWNRFFETPQQQAQQAAPTQKKTAEAPTDVRQVVREEITKASQVSTELTANQEQLERLIFNKFVTEHPDLWQNRRNEVLALWQGAAQANPALSLDPVKRYNLTIEQARRLFPSQPGTNLGGSTQGKQGGSNVPKTQQQKTFESMALTEAQAEEQRRQDLEKYVHDRKRQFGVRVGFPYDDLEK